MELSWLDIWKASWLLLLLIILAVLPVLMIWFGLKKKEYEHVVAGGVLGLVVYTLWAALIATAISK